MKTIKKTKKITSIAIAICLTLCITQTNTNCSFVEKSKAFASNFFTQKNLKKVYKNTSKTVGKTSKFLSRLSATNYGIKAIASTLFIAKNVTKFYNYRSNVKSVIMRHLPFYLENAGSFLNSFSNYDIFGSIYYGIKLLMGKNLVKATSNFIQEKIKENITKPIQDAQIAALNLNEDELKALKQKQAEDEENAKKEKEFYKQAYKDELQKSEEPFLFDFFTSKFGIGSIAQSMIAAANGYSFYNKENFAKTGIKSNAPFYLKNSGSLLNSFIERDTFSSVMSLSKIIAGKNITNKVASRLKNITPRFIRPMFFESGKETKWFWQN